MEYINDGFTLPVPLNLIPTPVSIYYMLKECLKRDEKTSMSKSNGDINNIEEPSVNINSQMQPQNGPVSTIFSKLENNNSKVTLIPCS
jgi:hypothetical protein